MPPDGSFDSLVRLFEQELRASESRVETPEPRPRPRRVSRELDMQVLQFVAEERKEGRTPEQMLVELKALLARAAPEVPGSERHALIATVTGRAINAFFEARRLAD